MSNALPMGAYKDDRLEKASSYTCVRRLSDQTIVTATATPVNFLAGAEIIEDDDGMFSTSSPAKLTVIRGGVYLLTGNIRFESNADGRRDLRFVVDSIVVGNTNQTALAAFATDISLSVLARCEIGDEITMDVRQTSGVSLALVSDTFSPRLAVMRLMP